MAEMESTGEPEQNRRSDAVANREKILAGSRAAFADLGIHAEIKDIADRSGVGVGTIYRNFENKDGLLRAIVQQAMDTFDAAMDQAERMPEPIAAIRSFLIAAMDLVDQYGWLFDAMLGRQLPDTFVHELRQEHDDNQRFEAMLQRAIDAGILREDLDLDISGRILMGTLLTWKYGKSGDATQPADAVDGVLEVFLHGAARH